MTDSEYVTLNSIRDFALEKAPNYVWVIDFVPNRDAVFISCKENETVLYTIVN